MDLSLFRFVASLPVGIYSRARMLSVFVLMATAFSSEAANRTWDGGDLDLPGFWSARTNWNGNSNIVAGDALFFPGTAAVKTMNNSLTISNFTKLTFNDDAYILNGNSLRLTNGITANYVPTGPTRINVGITLGDDSAFEADDNSATLELNGPVNLLGFILTNQGVGTVTWLAPFRSTAGGILRKRGTGTTLVRSTNANFLGTVEISGGDFNVNGRMPAGTINVNSGGTLGGTGLVHAVTVNNSGIIAPGGAARAVLTVTNGLTVQPRGIVEAEVLGSTAGLFDQLNVLGTVNLSNATLNLAVNFIPASPTAITIIANDGADAVLGTFSGLPQGATVLVNDSIRVTISYTGGTGNDVVLTVSPLDTLTWTGSVSGLWNVGANWVGGIAPQPGDSLIFPAVSVRKTTTNDFPADTVFGLMRLDTNYVLLGARAALRRGVHSFHTGGSPTVLLPLLLEASQTFTNQFQDITFTGDVDLGGFNLLLLSGSSAVDVTMSGAIKGVGAVTVEGPGQVLLDRSNSFTGVLDARGKVIVRHPAALGTLAQATLVATNSQLLLSSSLPDNSNIGEPLNLAGTLSGGASNLVWSGNVTFESPQVRVSINTNESLAFTGATLGADGFIKDGPGLLQLGGIQAAHGGTTFVKAGTLQIDTQLTNSALVVSNGATVTGRGRIKNHTFLAGSVLRPGDDNPVGPDVMTLEAPWNLRSNSVLRVRLDSPTDFDSVHFLGALNLGAGIVQLEPSLGYSAAVGDSFTIITRDTFGPTLGFFAGWPEGSTNLVDGQLFRITYTNNGVAATKPVVLTRVPTPQTWTGLGANDFWSTPENWAGNVAPTPGDRLIFPTNALRLTNVNDFAAGTIFHSLTISNRYSLTGNRLGLQAGIFAVPASSPSIRIAFPILLLASQRFVFSNSVTTIVLMEGDIDLGPHTLTLDCSGQVQGVFRGVISGAGSLVMDGDRVVSLGESNSYSGLTLIQSGTLAIVTGQSLGAPAAGTAVSNGASLAVSGSDPNITISEPLTLSGFLNLNPAANLVWDAPVTIQGNALMDWNRDTPAVSTFAAGLHGGGTLNLRNFSAVGQRVRLPATNNFSGAVTVQGCTLEVDGTLGNASLTLQNLPGQPATLEGTGLVRALTMEPGTILSPAGTNGGDGTISTLTVTESLVMQTNSTYRADLNGLGVQNYDQLDVLGTVNLGAGVANLDVHLGFTAPDGHTFVILDNDGADAITGTFAGLPQGATFTANGQRLRISYTGGTGNDVTLTSIVPATRVWRGLAANGDWSQPANWASNLVPADGDSVEFPDAPRPINTNNLPAQRYHQLLFTGTSGVARVLAPNTNSFVSLQISGGIDYRDTGTLRMPFTNVGFLNPRGFVQLLEPQEFRVSSGGTVSIDALTGLPGSRVTKTGGGILEIFATLNLFGDAVPMLVREGLLRLNATDAGLEQTGGTLEVLAQSQAVRLFGGDFRTAPAMTNRGVLLASLDAADATNAVTIQPGGAGAVGLITVTNGVTLHSNATLRVEASGAQGGLGLLIATNDLFNLDDAGDFRPNNARLELNFLPSFHPSPTNRLYIALSQNARTNLGNFAGLPQLGLLTNELGLFRIYYRDFAPPPPLDIIFGHGVVNDSVILERIAAPPVLLGVTNGPGAFKTVNGLGTPGALYVIEGSQDLGNWTALSGETASASGRITFIDVTGLPYRFYRASLP